MNQWLSARIKAYQVRKAMEDKHGIELYGEDLITAILNDQDIEWIEVSASDPLLSDREGNSQARYYTAEQFIVVQDNLPWAVRILLKAHEIGHHYLHTRQAVYTIDGVDPTNIVLTIPYAGGRIATYSSQQMQEHEATVFALELLMPSERLAALFDAGHTADEIAGIFLSSKPMLYAQMATALLSPVPSYDDLLLQQAFPPFHWTNLDGSQRKACCATAGPTLVQAGPGTGKTRTLTGRIEWLITKKGVPPEQILALTFSNKATDELRYRLRQNIPAVAHQVTVTTFHGFGLELLRRYANEIGLPPDISVLDPLEAEMILEDHLAELDLEYFSDPIAPDRFLDDIVRTIAKAKEELLDVVTCEQKLTDLASGDSALISTEELEQYHELCRVYRRYDEIIHKEGFVDYGDLVLLPISLLRKSSEVLKQLNEQYQHVLVDEYQDINRANGELVQLLAGDSGEKLWVVGDLRQSIYRWRGATSEYLAEFGQQCPNVNECFLETNYRS